MSVLKSAIIILVISASSVIWGGWYRSSHAMDGAIGMFFGGTVADTYTKAGWAMGVGALAFLVGIALLIAGLVQRGRNEESD